MTWASLADATDERRFGGKAARLAAAAGFGLPIPDGVALSVSLTEAAATHDPAAIAALEAIWQGLPGSVAVRSSVVGEDSTTASYAGQHATHLNVCSAADLRTAVVAIHESARAPAALAYRGRLGIEDLPETGVLLQAFVDAEVAGVMFTRSPLRGAQERLIEASWGLGVLVAAGRVVSDRYRLAPSGTVVERTAGPKHVALRPRPDGGTIEQPVPTELVQRRCLDDDHLDALAGLAARCEALFGAPQDVEWAFADGELWLLQVRPITT